jgi:hypothetical protein
MTTYKEIFGKYVKNYSSDPSSDAEGQVWYNTTSGTFKSVLASGTWSSGSPMITARRHLGDGGTQTSALAAGGLTTVYVATVEEYNGSGWSTGVSLSTARGILAGFGTQTAGVGAGGYKGGSPNTTAATEEYDGSSWAAGGNMATSRYGLTGCGTQIAGLAMGGATYPPATSLTNVEEYDGTNWTAGGSLPAATRGAGSAGTQTVALAFGGTINPSTQVATTLEYDGSAWTAGGNLGTARYDIVGAGTQTSAVAFGGQLPPGSARSSATELYNGSTWASTGNMGTAREGLGSANFAPQSAALAFGGYTGSNVDLTEEFNISSSIITAAAWAAGGNMTTGRIVGGGAGIQTAAIAFGGNQATPATPANPFMVNTEEYNGSSWSPGGNMGTARTNIGAAGTQTAALGFGGINATVAINSVEEYDGSTWSPGGLMNTATPYSRVGAGTQTAALGFGGAIYSGPGTFAVSNVSEEYNGSSWTSTPTMNTARYIGAGGGIVSAALSAGGYDGADYSSATEEYNGSAWTTVNPLPQKLNSQAFSGTQTAGLFFGGQFPSIPSSNIVNSISYDGTNYSTAPNLGTGRRALSGAGTQTAGLAFGGIISPQPAPVGNVASTEEFNGETTALNFKTITTS